MPAGDDARPTVYWDGTTGDDTYVARDMLSVNEQIAKPQWDAVDGGAGNDHIATRAGNDWLTGGQGNDLLEGGTGSDVYVFAEGDGADTIRETSTAGEKNYVLVSGAAAPTFEYDGSDLFVHYNSGADVIRVEQFFPSGLDEHAAISGVLLDRSETSVHPLEIFYSLDDIKAAVHIQSGGPADDTLIGSDANDFLFGNAGADTLEGGKGDDMLTGGAGDDTYVINLGDGMDTILDSFAEGENNTIVFGAGVDPGLVKLFKGSLGLDLGGGNTVHIEGVDYGDIADISSIRNFMFADGTLLSVEQLLARGFDVVGSADDDMLSGTSVSDRIDGGAGNDNLSGLAGNDVLNGNAGDDALIGGTGDDTYIVDSAADAIIENAGEGNDTVESGITLTLAANVENLTLAGAAAINGTGNTLNNVLTGNSAANALNGGEGSDWMIGGAGDDTYVVDHVRDVIAELYDEGVDLVQSDISYILGPNVEKLTLTGVGAINGRGNTLDNVLTGNSAANILNGGEGADTMIGGAGDDTYVVDNALDVVTENPDEGIDSVEFSKTFMLAPDVENLTLTGTGAINGTGNILDNVLKGNNSANKLTGAEGNDTLEGMGGNDTLTGGAGDDTYLIGRGYRTDTIVENDATAGNTDIAQFLSGIAVDQIWFKKSADNLEVSIIGTSDKFVVRDWYLDSAYRVEQFQTADDARTLLDSNVQNLVNAMASFAPPAAGQTTLPTSYQDALAGVIAANWQ